MWTTFKIGISYKQLKLWRFKIQLKMWFDLLSIMIMLVLWPLKPQKYVQNSLLKKFAPINIVRTIVKDCGVACVWQLLILCQFSWTTILITYFYGLRDHETINNLKEIRTNFKDQVPPRNKCSSKVILHCVDLIYGRYPRSFTTPVHEKITDFV